MNISALSSKKISETIALTFITISINKALVNTNKIGYLFLVWAAFTLGGLGSGLAANDAELKALAQKAFSCSDQILINQDLYRWKDLMYKVVMNDCDNCITVCNMENF